jgi:hypothetical protein
MNGIQFSVLNICGGSSLRSDEHKLKIFNAVDVAPVIWTPRLVGFHLLSYVQIRGCYYVDIGLVIWL